MSKKLLLADDSVTIQKVVNLTFADEGIEVLTASDGDTALQMLLAHKPDIVIADVNMPGPNGYQICERIKTDETLKNIPVILLVGSFEPFNEEEAKRVGADDFLTKPFQSIRHLMSKVSSLLESRASVAEETATREFDYRTLEAEEYPVAEIEDVTIHEEPAVSYVGELTYEEKTESDLAKTQPLSPEDVKEIKAEEIQGVSYEETPEVATVSEEQKPEHHIEEIYVGLVSSSQEEDATTAVKEIQEKQESKIAAELEIRDWATFGEVRQESQSERIEEARKISEEEKVAFEQKAETEVREVVTRESSEAAVEQPAESAEVVGELVAEQTAEPVAERVIEDDKEASELAVEESVELAERQATGIELEDRQVETAEVEKSTELGKEHSVEPVAESVSIVEHSAESPEITAISEEATEKAYSSEPVTFVESPEETGFIAESSESIQEATAQEIAQEPVQETEVAHDLRESGAETLVSQAVETFEKKREEEKIPQPDTVSLLGTEEDEILELPIELPGEPAEAFAQHLVYRQAGSEEAVSAQEVTTVTAEKREYIVNLPPEIIEAIAQKVAEKVVEGLSERAIKEIAWEVVPQQAELIIRKMVEERLKK